VPKSQQVQQLKGFAEEIFELSKDVWAAQSRGKAKDQTEISETEFLALDLLSKSDQAITVGNIQRHIGVLPAQMSRIIRSLESKGESPLIYCKINPKDKRKIDVELSPPGIAAHQAYRQMKLGSIERMLLGLTQHDQAEFMRILRLIRSEMHKAFPQK